MNWLEFIAAIVASIAWPVAIVVILVLLRDEVKVLLQNLRVTKLKIRNVEAEFSESVRSIEEEFSRLKVSRVIKDEPVPDASRHWIDVDPNYAVFDAWKRLEGSLKELAVGKYGHSERWSVVRHVTDLMIEKAIDESVGRVILELSNARNKIAHQRDSIERVEALRYIDLAEDVTGYLKNLHE